jgi:integrase
MDQEEKQIVDAIKIKQFLMNFKSKSTRTSYRSHIKKFFETIKADPDTYFDSKRDYESDVKKFAQSINGSPPLSQKTTLACVRTFLSEYDIELKSKIWRAINNRIKGRAPVTDNVKPTNSQLKQILQHADAKSKALFLVMSNSGMRISEALHLTFNDVDVEKRNITIPGAFTKNGNTCHTYFTEEAKDAMLEWLKERETYLKYSFYKSKYVRAMFAKRGIIIDRKDENSDWTIMKNGVEISNNDLIKEENRIFPFSRGIAEKVWNNLLEKTGSPLNEKVHDPRLSHPRYKYHIHTLRKFFTGSLSNDGVPEAFIDKYVNHTEQYHGAYKSKTLEELKDMYEKHCGCLAVFSDLDKVHKQIKPKLQEQDIAISSLTRENERLHKEIEMDKFQIDKLQESVKEIQKILLLRTGDRTEEEIKNLKHHGLLKDDD